MQSLITLFSPKRELGSHEIQGVQPCLSLDLHRILHATALHRFRNLYWVSGSHLVTTEEGNAFLLSQAKNKIPAEPAHICLPHDSHQRHGCLCLFYVCAILYVRSDLDTGQSPSKESFRLCVILLLGATTNFIHVLVCSTIDFHLFLSCAHLFQLTMFIVWMSSITLFIHLMFGRPTSLRWDYENEKFG
jgi:hypothetical protein